MRKNITMAIILNLILFTGTLAGCGSASSVEDREIVSEIKDELVSEEISDDAVNNEYLNTETYSNTTDKELEMPVVAESVQDKSSSIYEKHSLSFLDGASKGDEQAYKKALSYLEHSAFSYTGLIEQLEFEGFSTEEATFAADNCGADWFAQAIKSAESYMKSSSFSQSGLVEQLEYEGFTTEQATQAAAVVFGGASDESTGGSVSQQNALRSAKSYLDFSAFSYKGLIEQLEYEGFSSDDAIYAADNCGADWKEQAVKQAESYLSFSSFSRSDLVEQLEYEGFTHEEAEYGVTQVGY